MGNQPSAMEPEDAARQILRDGRNARVLDLPPELGASDELERELPATSGASEPPRDVDDATSAAAPSPAAPRRRVEEFYDVQSELLGRGHYAVVCRGRCRRTGRAVAIKKIKRFLTDPKRLRAEIVALRRVKQHPNIVELVDVFETTREVHLVLELCTGGELFERLAEKGAYSEADCVRHVRDMARAVKYLHECGIVHRDLKPENILLSTPDDHDAVVKVADFGLAKVFTGTSLKTKCGTWGYSAPEMISGSGSTFGYDDKVDSWSLGTILYILLCGYHPFDPEGGRSDNEMIASIKACNFEFDDDGWATISDGAKDLVRHLLVLDPEERFSMAQVLEHPWISGSSPAALHASEMPLSPTIHYELAKYREHTKQKLGFGSLGDHDDDDDDNSAASVAQLK
ncbi:hypothetical protein PR003_g11726 [Phytophthora rubi]|uniref:Protein kinase domain-containing protein n=1 Tax=Phytophthora rubi TaxID=129364 RepID=A0A6A4F7B3_9STRA|nr:hypothetical protein PR002_g21261 [Phytophthora rubi]KAE9029705.1 hypothetical protein PR001_g11456 [Phytophthora rubi]KAE9338013.1 hypothetical protein PR003_g11726 [Phytophthora rubi]